MLKQLSMIVALAAAVSLTDERNAQAAAFSEPDLIYLGKAPIAAENDVISLRLVATGEILVTCTLKSDLVYKLVVPLSYNGRLPKTANVGDSVEILKGTQVIRSTTITSRGRIVNLLLDVAHTAEQWALDHPGDNGSGDMNRNGISDLNEYLADQDPAGCAWIDTDASHREANVYHSKVLASCLTDAGEDGRHNLIRIGRGTYAGTYSYASGWREDYNLNIQGGFDPAGTSVDAGTLVTDPTLSILDAAGSGSVLTIDTDTSKTAGTIRIENLTVRNGANPTGNGGGIKASISGAFELVGAILTTNTVTSGGGGGMSVEHNSNGRILLVNNLIHGNGAANAAAVQMVAPSDSQVTLLNNTIVDNFATVDGNGRSLVMETSSATVDISNTIVRGASSVIGAEVYLNSYGSPMNATIRNNNLDSSAALYSNTPGFSLHSSNSFGDPHFAAPQTGNYRLQFGSAGINTGRSHVSLPATDADGATRVVGLTPDMGAYELQIQPTLTVSISGPGSVHGTSIPHSQSYSCASGSCSPSPLAYGEEITLNTTGSNSVFTGWSDDCTGTDPCTLTMDGNKSVTATFTPAAGRVRVEGNQSLHASIAAALAVPQQDDEIRAQGTQDFIEHVIMSTPVSIVLKGGYSDAGFSSQSGVTTISGSLRIQGGKLTVELLKIKP